MSVAHRQPEVAPSAARARREVVIRWSTAAGALAPGARGAAVVEITARRDEDGLVWLEAGVVAGGQRRSVRTVGPLEAGAWSTDITGLEHVEAGPTLRATLRPGAPGEGPTVLFAQTDVLAALRVGGGRYDRPA